MKQNVGNTDRVIRIFVAVVIGCAGYLYGLWWLYIIALIPLIEGIIGYCPLYNILKMNTNKQNRRKK